MEVSKGYASIKCSGFKEVMLARASKVMEVSKGYVNINSVRDLKNLG